MGETKVLTCQLASSDALPVVGTVENATLSLIMQCIDRRFTHPLSLDVNGSILTCEASEIDWRYSNATACYESDEGKKVGISLLDNQYVLSEKSYLDITDGSVTGDFQLTAPPSISEGEEIFLGLELTGAGKIISNWGTAGASGTLTPASVSFNTDNFPVGAVKLVAQSTGSGWGLFTDPARSAIHEFGKGGGSGSGAGDSGLSYKSLSGSTLSLKKGSIRLSDQTIVTSPSGGAGDIDLNLSSLVSSPVDDTTYFVYIDLNGVSSSFNSDGVPVLELSSSNFVCVSTEPESMTPARYIFVAWVRRGTAAWTASGSYAGRFHNLTSGDTAVEIERIEITTSTSGTSYPHGLSDRPQIISCEYMDSASAFYPLNVADYVSEVDDTNITIATDALSFSSGEAFYVYCVRIPDSGGAAVGTGTGAYTKIVQASEPTNYETLTDALAESASGDYILVKEGYQVQSIEQITLNHIKIDFMPDAFIDVASGGGFELTGENIVINNPHFTVSCSGTIDDVVLVSGFDCVINDAYIHVDTASGTVTNAFRFSSSSERNRISGSVKTSQGTVTNIVVDDAPLGNANDYNVAG